MGPVFLGISFLLDNSPVYSYTSIVYTFLHKTIKFLISWHDQSTVPRWCINASHVPLRGGGSSKIGSNWGVKGFVFNYSGGLLSSDTVIGGSMSPRFGTSHPLPPPHHPSVHITWNASFDGTFCEWVRFQGKRYKKWLMTWESNVYVFKKKANTKLYYRLIYAVNVYSAH